MYQNEVRGIQETTRFSENCRTSFSAKIFFGGVTPPTELAARPFSMGHNYIRISKRKRSFIKIGTQTTEIISEQTDRHTYTYRKISGTRIRVT